MADKKTRFLRILGYCTAPAVAVFTVLSAYGGIVNPAVSPVPAIMAMTFPLWIFLSFALLVVCLLVKSLRRVALFPAAALMASWGPLMDFAPVNLFTGRSGSGDGAFSVMSYNTYYLTDITADSISADPKQWKREVEAGMTNPTADYMIATDPDIILAQEFPTLVQREQHHFLQWQIDTLKHRYPGIADVDGECVFSRWKLTPVKLRQPDSRYARFSAAMADIDGHPVLLVSVHMQSIGLSDDDKELYRDLTEGEGGKRLRQVKRQLLGKLAYAFKMRAAQARLLRTQIDSLGVENVIIGGDFNDIPSCYALRELCGDDFRNAFADAALGPMITYHANRFYFHIDHIVYRGKMKAVGFERGTCPNSDHYPVIARFIWEDD